MSNVVPFRRPVRPWQCPHCQTWMLPGSITERMHGETPDRCPKLIIRLAREALRQEAEAIRASWHRQERKRLRKTRKRATAPKRPATPLPRRQPSQAEKERIDRLRMALCCPQTRAAIMRTTRLPEAALDRVALGRSTLAPTQWRRVLEALGSGAR